MSTQNVNLALVTKEALKRYSSRGPPGVGGESCEPPVHTAALYSDNCPWRVEECRLAETAAVEGEEVCCSFLLLILRPWKPLLRSPAAPPHCPLPCSAALAEPWPCASNLTSPHAACSVVPGLARSSSKAVTRIGPQDGDGVTSIPGGTGHRSLFSLFYLGDSCVLHTSLVCMSTGPATGCPVARESQPVTRELQLSTHTQPYYLTHYVAMKRKLNGQTVCVGAPPST